MSTEMLAVVNGQMSIPSEGANSDAGTRHILVVECNPEDASLIRRALKALPFCTSFLCRSLREAEAYLSGTGIYTDRENYPLPDAIITELRLGQDSAYELLAWLRSSEPLRNIPVHVFAGSVSPEDKALLSALNLKKIVEKPAALEERTRVLQALAGEICGAK